jgi:uncharacterized protein (TIGR03083 family)
VTLVTAIPPLEHDEAMALAETELGRLLALVDDLVGDDWTRPTDCTGWTVRDMLGHLLGMFALQADPEERTRQINTAAELAGRSGELRINEMTALQVREHADLGVEQLRRAMHEAGRRGLAARRGVPPVVRTAPYDSELPGEGMWTIGYLFDVIHTRDPWLHRVDICRATGRVLELTAGARRPDRRRRRGRLDATARHAVHVGAHGTCGRHVRRGDGWGALAARRGRVLRILSGRSPGTGLLTTPVTF